MRLLYLQGDYKKASRIYSKALRYLDPGVFEDGQPVEADLERMANSCCPLMLNR